MQQTLFVCGSLCEGMIHFNRISPYIQSAKKAYVRGSVYRLEVGFPVFINEGDTRVEGFLIELSASEIFYKLMDEFYGYSSLTPESSLHFKSEITAVVEGLETPTTVYHLNPKKLPKTAKQIETGDWRKSLEEQPPLTEKLTEIQKLYINKLGQASGRDIVPIKLDLYRELMGKGLIVDKGRRLALSSLGQEVFRFLE